MTGKDAWTEAMWITLLWLWYYWYLAFGKTIQPKKGGEYTTMCNGPHPFIPVTNVARVDMIYQTLGGYAENVYHIQGAAGIDESSMNDWTEAFYAWEVNVGANHRAGDISLVEIRMQDLSEEDGVRTVFVPTPPVPGEVASPVMPGNVTLAVKFLSNRSGRSRNGRHFWIGLTESMCVGDEIQPASLTAILEDYEALRLGLAELSAQLVNVSYCGDGEWRTSGLVTPVIAFNADAVLDSQRRRLLGRGR